VEIALAAVEKRVVGLRFLGSGQAGQAGLSMAAQVEWSKLMLWRIGENVDAIMASSWDHALGVQSVWEVVASMTDHKQGGDKLQRMYQAMKERGYQPPTFIGGQSRLVLGEGGTVGVAAVHVSAEVPEISPLAALATIERRSLLGSWHQCNFAAWGARGGWLIITQTNRTCMDKCTYNMGQG
jgi:hypothetical protein